ncbi:MAG: HlyC/CorC family transporter [Rhodospirillaceae bacterium]|nr:MAG: HlyC/CorC family transporter [Rhodospirillaceae bacterium]
MSDLSHSRTGRGEPFDEAKTRLGLKSWLRFWRRRPGGENALRDAIEELIEESEGDSEDSLATSESSLLLNILKLGDQTAYDVMVPRVDIKGAPEDISLTDLITLMREHGHSRLPIYRDNLDDIVGIVHIKDLLPFVVDNTPFRLTQVMREAMFIAPSIRVLDLLLQMRLARAHLVLVVDEFGGIDGLVTIEDLIEQIIGEIEDEHDKARGPFLVRRADGTLFADARTPIEDFEELVGPMLTEEEREADIDTLGGLVMSLTDRVPSRGELVTHPSGVAFEVLDADPRRIKRLRVRNLPTPADETAAD